MILYQYTCANNHSFESIEKMGTKETQCPFCELKAKKDLTFPHFTLSWIPLVVDSAKDVWEGTALEGTDGINPLHYKSDRIQIDSA